MAARYHWGLSLVLTLIVVTAGSLRANGIAALSSGASPLWEVRAPNQATASPSLFNGTREGSLFAPFPVRTPTNPDTGMAHTPGAVGDLLTLIAQAEAGQAGYNAVQHGARIGTPRPPTEMTLGDIYEWIDATPGQPHAIGRYQFIPPTLRRVANARGYGPETPFSPAVQDELALVLLEEAGLRQFEDGTLGRNTFMHNLARIWAGLPLQNGQSYYHGYAGNRASMTWETFADGIDQIWPRG